MEEERSVSEPQGTEHTSRTSSDQVSEAQVTPEWRGKHRPAQSSMCGRLSWLSVQVLDPRGENTQASDSSTFSWARFLLAGLPCPISAWQFLSYLILRLLMLYCYLLEACCFLMKEKKSGSGQMGGRRGETGEAV